MAPFGGGLTRSSVSYSITFCSKRAASSIDCESAAQDIVASTHSSANTLCFMSEPRQHGTKNLECVLITRSQCTDTDSEMRRHLEAIARRHQHAVLRQQLA